LPLFALLFALCLADKVIYGPVVCYGNGIHQKAMLPGSTWTYYTAAYGDYTDPSARLYNCSTAGQNCISAGVPKYVCNPHSSGCLCVDCAESSYCKKKRDEIIEERRRVDETQSQFCEHECQVMENTLPAYVDDFGVSHHFRGGLRGAMTAMSDRITTDYKIHNGKPYAANEGQGPYYIDYLTKLPIVITPAVRSWIHKEFQLAGEQGGDDLGATQCGLKT